MNPTFKNVVILEIFSLSDESFPAQSNLASTSADIFRHLCINQPDRQMMFLEFSQILSRFVASRKINEVNETVLFAVVMFTPRTPIKFILKVKINKRKIKCDSFCTDFE